MHKEYDKDIFVSPHPPHPQKLESIIDFIVYYKFKLIESIKWYSTWKKRKKERKKDELI